MKEIFRKHRFTEEAQGLLGNANAIVKTYQAQGLRLTLRQLYYQLVTRNVIRNEERQYKRLSGLLSDARLMGLVDWGAIEDRIRQPRKHPEFDGLPDLVETALHAYRLPRWDGQRNYVELWVEKDALAGVLWPIASDCHVTLMVNRGYCVAPEVKILTADLRWKKADSIEPGMEILGVDENPPAYRKHRKLRVAHVTGVRHFDAPRVKVTTDWGEIIVSENHPFLTTKLTHAGDHWHGYRWAQASSIKPGERIARLCKPWAADSSWTAGWLAGVYDGEGCLPATRLNTEIDVYQNEGIVSGKIRETLQRYGWLGVECVNKNTGTIAFKTYGVDKVLELIGTLRPVRMLEAFDRDIRRRGFPSKSKKPATVLGVEKIGMGAVVGVETDLHTLITDGLVSHNSSQSAMYDAARRFLVACYGKDPVARALEPLSDEHPDVFMLDVVRLGAPRARPVLLYLGDHDPSGEDMVRDIRSRMEMFGVAGIDVRKLALTREQIEEHRPPPNPAKLTDPRSREYVEKHGQSSWEVDALPPDVLDRMVRDEIDGLLDRKKWDRIVVQEERDKKALMDAVRKIRRKP